MKHVKYQRSSQLAWLTHSVIPALAELSDMPLAIGRQMRSNSCPSSLVVRLPMKRLILSVDLLLLLLLVLTSDQLILFVCCSFT